MKGTGARALALEAVRRVVDDGAYSNVAIPSLLGRSSLDRRDRAFAAELAYGTLRRRPILDRAIAARPDDRGRVRHAVSERGAAPLHGRVR